MVVFHVVIFLFFKFASLLRDGFGVKGLEPKTVYSIRTLETARFDADTKSRIKLNLIKGRCYIDKSCKKNWLVTKVPNFTNSKAEKKENEGEKEKKNNEEERDDGPVDEKES